MWPWESNFSNSVRNGCNCSSENGVKNFLKPHGPATRINLLHTIRCIQRAKVFEMVALLSLILTDSNQVGKETTPIYLRKRKILVLFDWHQFIQWCPWDVSWRRAKQRWNLCANFCARAEGYCAIARLAYWPVESTRPWNRWWELLQGGGSHTSGRRRAQGCTLVLPPPPSPLLCLSSPPFCLVLPAARSPLPSADAPVSSRCTVPLHQHPLWVELALLSLLTCLTPIAVLFLLTRTLHGSSRR